MRCFIPSLSSNSFIFRRLEPKFLRRSGYSHLCRSREHVPHCGLIRSHLSFLLLQDTHDIVFSWPLAPVADEASDGCDFPVCASLELACAAGAVEYASLSRSSGMGEEAADLEKGKKK